MAAKKKPGKEILVPAKPKKRASNLSDNDRVAREMAKVDMTDYVHSPTNRSQVIMPTGKNFPVGSDDYLYKTKGRFRAAETVYKKSYKKHKTNLDKLNPQGSKPTVTKTSVSKASTRSKKKK